MFQDLYSPHCTAFNSLVLSSCPREKCDQSEYERNLLNIAKFPARQSALVRHQIVQSPAPGPAQDQLHVPLKA